jgi:tRNA pseudouridine32 synthase/23S rRNA pseudouridine746 synthase
VSDAAPLVLLHEDDDVVAVQKPPGEPVIPARDGSARDCVQRRLERQLGRRLWVVHRIDRDASGVVVFATNAAAHRALSLAFEHRQVSKAYVAFVAGAVEPSHGRLDVPLHAARKGKTRPARPGEPGAQTATTEYATRMRWSMPGGSREAAIEWGTGGPVDIVSLLDAHPHTGRHHQIRVHLRSLGVPILFDPLYGRGLMPEALAGAPCARLALHARMIDLPAPRGEGRLVVEAPLATDLAALAVWLDACARGEHVGA